MVNEFKFLNKEYDTFENDKKCKVDEMLIGVAFFTGAVCVSIATIIIQISCEVFFSR